MLSLSVSVDFAKTPGFREPSQGPNSGEEFRNNLLEPMFLKAIEANEKLVVNLDGTDGYLPSFLEEAFGGLKRKHPTVDVLAHITFISNEEKYLIEDIQRYVKEALDERKK